MSAVAVLDAADRVALRELAPVLRRAVDLEPKALARLRIGAGIATVLVRLPFGVLVSRGVEAAGTAEVRDLTLAAGEVLAWLDADADADADAAADADADTVTGVVPARLRRRDADWRAGLPPSRGWRRIESVPDDVVRSLVRSGAVALKDAAAREGVPGAQPRSEVADALLDSVVLTVRDDRDPAAAQADVTLRALSALTRMGFLPRGGQLHVDVAGRWIRVVAGYGTVYLERPGSGLGLLAP